MLSFSITDIIGLMISMLCLSKSQWHFQVVRMTLSMYNGDSSTCGTMSTGGTESIMLAIYAYRNHAKEELGIENPEM